MKKQFVIFSAFVVFMSINLAVGAADFSISTFSCTPSEAVINDVFSCTAQIENVGDSSGSVNEVRLYPDSSSWLEQTNYLKNSGSSVSPGQTTEVTFTGLRATKSGNNGFSRITLDNQADTWVADNNVKENIIDASIGVTNSVSSTTSGNTFTVTPEVTAGGNIDATLTFVVDSGACSIGIQSSTRSTTGLLDQQKWTPSAWTVTMGSGNCRYTLTASLTGANGVASTTISSGNTITCSDCSSSSSSSSSGGGGGSGGGASPTLGELKTAVAYELGADFTVRFSFGTINHTFSVLSITDTTATVTIKSEPQTFVFNVGDEKSIDINDDNIMDISVKLKSINIITKKANFIFTPLYAPASSVTGSAIDTPKVNEQKTDSSANGGTTDNSNSVSSGFSPEENSGNWLSILKILGILCVIVLVLIAGYHFWNNSTERRLIRSVNMKRFTPERLNLGNK